MKRKSLKGQVKVISAVFYNYNFNLYLNKFLLKRNSSDTMMMSSIRALELLQRQLIMKQLRGHYESTSGDFPGIKAVTAVSPTFRHCATYLDVLSQAKIL